MASVTSWNRTIESIVLTDLQQVLDEAARTDPNLALFLRLNATTGMRRGEVCGLQWGDLDVRNATLTVSRAVVSVPNGTIVTDTKTHAVRRLPRRGDSGPVSWSAVPSQRGTDQARSAGHRS